MREHFLQQPSSGLLLLDLQEQNPLGIALPQVVSNKLTQWVNQVFPAKWIKAPEVITLNSAQTTETVAG